MGSLLCCLHGPADDNEQIHESHATDNSSAHAVFIVDDLIISFDALLERGALGSMQTSSFSRSGRGLNRSQVEEVDIGSKALIPQIPMPEEDCTILEYDECLICLEEYTNENPRIPTKCSHHYHLSCILEWQQRSEFCPVCCSREMEFEEMS